MNLKVSRNKKKKINRKHTHKKREIKRKVEERTLKVEVVRLKPIKEQALYDDSSETKLKETDQIHQQRKNWSSVLCEFSKHVAEGGVD